MKTGYVVFQPKDAPKDVPVFVKLLHRFESFKIKTRAEVDGSIKVSFTGPGEDVDMVLRALMSGKRAVFVQSGQGGDA